MNWTQALEGFGRYLAAERNLSPHTRRAYSSDLRQLTLHTGPEVAPDRVDADHVQSWLASLHKRRSPATLGRKLASVRAFYRWMLREGYVSDDPTAGMPMPKQEQRLPHPLSVDDCEQLITRGREIPAATANGDGPRAWRARWMRLRDRALVELLYGTGIRIGELVALDVRDLELAAREIRVMGKGRKERIVPIPEQARIGIQVYSLSRSSSRCGRGGKRSRGASPPAKREGSWVSGRWEPISPSAFTPTGSGTAMPPISSIWAPISERSRSFWDTPACRPPRNTPRCRSSVYARPMMGHIRVRC